MRALLSFVPRPRMKTAKTRKQILGGLIDDIQVIAPLEDSELALQVAAEFLHTPRGSLRAAIKTPMAARPR
jgi:hypothetical protein